MKLGFYLLGQKGYTVLRTFLAHYDSNKVGFIVVSKDLKIDNDFYDEIFSLCQSYKVPCFNKNDGPGETEKTVCYTFAIGWRWLIKDSENLIVLHDSLLPKYRGFSPLVNMLINGERKLGVTALFATSDYDKGDIINQESIRIEYPIRISEAIDIISKLYGNLIIKISKNIFSNIELSRVPQLEKDATYSMWRDEYDYAIDWRKDSNYIARFVNAVSTPFAGAHSFILNKKVRITDVETITDICIEDRNIHIGKCIFKQKNKPVIICGTGLLLLNTIYWDESKSDVLDTLNFRTRLTTTPRDF